MSEDLLGRLRDWPYQGETMAGQAADRIEALEAAILKALRARDEDIREILRKARDGE